MLTLVRIAIATAVYVRSKNVPFCAILPNSNYLTNNKFDNLPTQFKQLPVIILTLTPRFNALRIVSALSCLGGSKRGINPINCQGPPGLSFLPSGTSCDIMTNVVSNM